MLKRRRHRLEIVKAVVCVIHFGSSIVHKRLVLSSALAATLATFALPVVAGAYAETVFFGDSLTDSGHFRPLLEQTPGLGGRHVGKFTTNPHLVWSERLAEHYGGSAISSNQGGNNFAVGGARAGIDTTGSVGLAPSVASQVSGYLAMTGSRADPNVLYSVWAGANDLFAIASGEPVQATIAAAVASTVDAVTALNHAGAKYVMVSTVPDLGLTPSSREQGETTMVSGTALAEAYNQALFGGLAAAHARAIPLDTFHLIQEIAADPSAYGIFNVTEAACAPTGSSSVVCDSSSLFAQNAGDTYLFADGVHPSGKGHAILADYAMSVLEAPRQLAALPRAVAALGLSRAGRVFAQAERMDGDTGLWWWTDIRADRIDTTDSNDTTPSVLVGTRWSGDDLTLGAFMGYGANTADWVQARGQYSMRDIAVGGFLGWREHAAWFHTQLSYARQKFEIDRNVALGPAVRRHTGSTDGGDLTIAVRAGWDFEGGSVLHGPLLSLVSQSVEVDGYSEEGNESTSLRFGSQRRNSTIASAGWHFDYAASPSLTPYGRITFDRELKAGSRELQAQLRSMEGLSYAVPGTAYDRGYGTVIAGVRTKIARLHANVGSSLAFGQDDGNDVSIFISIGSGF